MTAVLIVVAMVTVVAMFRPDPDLEGLGVRNPLGIGPADVPSAWQFLLRGPALRQLGAAGAEPRFSVHVPGSCAELPAAVEVAAYRIAAEACAPERAVISSRRPPPMTSPGP